MATVNEKPLYNMTDKQHEEIKAQVCALLEKTPSYRKLSADEQNDIARNMTKVASLMAEPLGKNGGSAVDALAGVLAAGSGRRGGRKSGEGLVGSEFEGGAAREGAAVFREFVDAVDFPEFVSGLIEGVFTSIVDSSIRQMQEYARFLEAVVKSVGDFAKDHLTDNEARDHIRDKYPSIFDIDTSGPQPQLQIRPGVDEDAMPDFREEFGLEEQPDLSEPEGELKLVKNARLELARMRQQQLSAMVLLGINRIVVTDGSINAKVVFDVKAEDTASRKTATSFDRESDYSRQQTRRSIWGTNKTKTSTTVSTAMHKSNTTDSDSKLNAKAKLTGEVRVNFKSDYFPLEKIATPAQLTAVEGRNSQ